MHKFFYILCLSYLVLQIGLSMACKHDPTFPVEDMMPNDTITNPGDTIVDPGDTTIIDTIDMNPCDSNVVYFNMQILPILQSNCAFSGCHDAATASDGIILESYAQVFQTTDIEAFDLSSDLYEVIIDSDPDKRMPPPPNNPLSTDQIQLIAKWILQGAEDLDCDSPEDCETEDVSYSSIIRPIIQNNCQGCHSGNLPSGGIDLSTYEGVSAVANSGQLFGAIAYETGFSPMPQGAAPLPECTIEQIKSWIDAGAPNN